MANSLKEAERKIILMWPVIAMVYTVASFVPWVAFLYLSNEFHLSLGGLAGVFFFFLGLILVGKATPDDAMDTLTSVPFYSPNRTGINRLVAAVVWFLQAAYGLIGIVSNLVFLAAIVAGLLGWSSEIWQ